MRMDDTEDINSSKCLGLELFLGESSDSQTLHCKYI